MTLEELIEHYESDRGHFLKADYNETQLRTDFLDPFFELLGWDIKNAQGKKTSEREVLVEEGLKAGHGENTKKPDYTFRLFSERKFFLEAKKPSIDISTHPAPAKQTRRYGFTAKLKISVVSNFEYLAIYDCSEPVVDADSVNKARVKLYHYTEYVDRFDEIYALLSKEIVYSGQFEDEWVDIEKKLQKFSVDTLFLKQINSWRLKLSANFLTLEPKITEEELNDLTQGYINSIVFLRVCEDRNLEEYQTLLHYAETTDNVALIKLLETSDKKYNSGLFDLELIDKMLDQPTSSVWSIIKELYYPESSYSFSVFSSDILGNIYEMFLGEKIAIVDGKAVLVKKPDNVDRDIVTTPLFIIRNIIEKSVSEFIQAYGVEEIFTAKFSDIACGSGAFLLELYQLLQDELTDHYLKHDKSKLTQLNTNTFKLNFDVKRELLENCIYGIDKDFNAVQACRFGLLLKLLEYEDDKTITIPALPDLDKNIIFGNSLISPKDTKAAHFDVINPFKIEDMKFDMIVGNPPYLKTEDMKLFTPLELSIYKKNYVSAYKQFDKYFLFVERALNCLSDRGILGFILPLKFMKVGAAKKLRELLIHKKAVTDIVSFGANQVFADKTTYTCLLFATKSENNDFTYTEVMTLASWQSKNTLPTSKNTISIGSINPDCWTLMPKFLEKSFKHIAKNSVSLVNLIGKDNIGNGIQTSSNDVYIQKAIKENSDYYFFEKDGQKWKVEKELTRPYFKTPRGKQTADLSLNTYRALEPNSFVIYPYKMVASKLEFVPLNDLSANYPFVYKYFLAHKAKLLKRDIQPTPSNSDEWYRFGRHQSLENCDVPQKIIVGVNSQGDKYAVDKSRTLISSGGTAGYCYITVPDSIPYDFYYIQALVNSKYGEWFASLYGEVFRGGYIARGTKVFANLPIVEINFGDKDEKKLHDQIVSTQKKLISLQGMIDGTKTQRKLIPLKRQFDGQKDVLDSLLKDLFSLGSDDNKIPLIKDMFK